MRLARNAERSNRLRPARPGIVRLGAGEECVAVPVAAGEENRPVAEKRRRVPAASDGHPSGRREVAGSGIEQLDRGEIQAVVAACDHHPAVGKRRGRVSGARFEHVTRAHDRIAARIEDLERWRGVAARRHPAGDEDLPAGQRRHRMRGAADVHRSHHLHARLRNGGVIAKRSGEGGGEEGRVSKHVLFPVGLCYPPAPACIVSSRFRAE